MPYSYLVLGAGRQGTAAAYDLLRFGDAERVTLADADQDCAVQSAARLERLTGQSNVAARRLDVADSAAVRDAVSGHDVVLSAVPYYFNLALTARPLMRASRSATWAATRTSCANNTSWMPKRVQPACASYPTAAWDPVWATRWRYMP